jgi:hypothetical protein
MSWPSSKADSELEAWPNGRAFATACSGKSDNDTLAGVWCFALPPLLALASLSLTLSAPASKPA